MWSRVSAWRLWEIGYRKFRNVAPPSKCRLYQLAYHSSRWKLCWNACETIFPPRKYLSSAKGCSRECRAFEGSRAHCPLHALLNTDCCRSKHSLTLRTWEKPNIAIPEAAEQTSPEIGKYLRKTLHETYGFSLTKRTVFDFLSGRKLNDPRHRLVFCTLEICASNICMNKELAHLTSSLVETKEITPHIDMLKLLHV